MRLTFVAYPVHSRVWLSLFHSFPVTLSALSLIHFSDAVVYFPFLWVFWTFQVPIKSSVSFHFFSTSLFDFEAAVNRSHSTRYVNSNHATVSWETHLGCLLWLHAVAFGLSGQIVRHKLLPTLPQTVQYINFLSVQGTLSERRDFNCPIRVSVSCNSYGTLKLFQKSKEIVFFKFSPTTPNIEHLEIRRKFLFEKKIFLWSFFLSDFAPDAQTSHIPCCTAEQFVSSLKQMSGYHCC